MCGGGTQTTVAETRQTEGRRRLSPPPFLLPKQQQRTGRCETKGCIWMWTGGIRGFMKAEEDGDISFCSDFGSWRICVPCSAIHPHIQINILIQFVMAKAQEKKE